MSVGSIIGGIVGGIIGWFCGGPWGAYWGIMLGAGLGGIIDPIEPDIPTAGRMDTSELSFTTAEEGVPIADLLGSPKMTGNIIGYWNNRSEEVKEQVEGGKGGGGSQSVTTGYKYYLSWLMGICMGPVDTLYSIYQGDKLIWEGELDRPVSGGQYDVVIPDFGTVTFYYGTDDQIINSTMQGLADDSTLVPAYRHLCCAFFDDCFIGERNTLPIMRFVVKKTPEYDFNSGYETIEDYDYNAAHALYHILVTMSNLDESWIDEDSFDLAAKELYCEGLGISVLMNKQVSALTYLETLLYHMNAILIFRHDGKFGLTLLRKTKPVELLPVIDETMMIDDLALERKSWLNTINEIKIQHPLRYYESEVNGEATEGDGRGDCSTAPTLNYIGCIEESYYFYSQAGKYTVSNGCGPFLLYYKDENMSVFEKVKDIYSREFTYLCRSIVCAGDGEDREIKILDKGNDQWSNTLNIAVTEAPVFGLTAGPFEVNAGSSASVSVAGGKPAYYWTLTGRDVFFDSEFTIQEIQTVSSSVLVYAKSFDDLSNKNGSSSILNVSDGCISLDVGNVSVLTCCSELPNGPLSFDEDLTPDTITGNSSIILYTDGGCGPYTFRTSSQGYHFGDGAKSIESESGDVTIYCINGSCGIDYDPELGVSVRDACGNSDNIEIRNSSGEWKFDHKVPICGSWICGECYIDPTFGHTICYEGVYKIDTGWGSGPDIPDDGCYHCGDSGVDRCGNAHGDWIACEDWYIWVCPGA